MFLFYKAMTDATLNDLHKREDTLLNEFKREFSNSYSDVLSEHKIHSEIGIYRWTDQTTRWLRNKYDGYSVMIQIDLLNDENSIIELDESICSCFLTVTYVSFLPLKRKYRVYQADNLYELWKEVKGLMNMLNTGHMQ